MSSALHRLLFENDDNFVGLSRLQIDARNSVDIRRHAKETRRSMQNAIEVIATLTSCARGGQPPPASLENEASASIQLLSQFVRALDDVQDFAERVNA